MRTPRELPPLNVDALPLHVQERKRIFDQAVQRKKELESMGWIPHAFAPGQSSIKRQEELKRKNIEFEIILTGENGQHWVCVAPLNSLSTSMQKVRQAMLKGIPSK